MRAVQADSVLRGLEKQSTGASTPWPGLRSCSHLWLTAQVRGASLGCGGEGGSERDHNAPSCPLSPFLTFGLSPVFRGHFPVCDSAILTDHEPWGDGHTHLRRQHGGRHHHQ